MPNKLIVIAIETSCDETSVSILEASNGNFRVLSNEISSQVKLHAKWGGVVPNLAAREHTNNITTVFELSLQTAKVKIEDIDLIAVTEGPGLIPALMIGTTFAKTIAYLLEKPLIGIHHIEGHIYANLIRGISNSKFQISNEKSKSKIINSKLNNSKLIQNSKLEIGNFGIIFPVLCLVVSGGHTQLVYMKDHLSYEIIGQTLDDAAGEAFDKVARILNIGYPGGPAISAYAEKFRISNFEFRKKNEFQNSDLKIDSKFPPEADRPMADKIQNSKLSIHFPRPMMNNQGFNFSFSGLKTAVLYETKKRPSLIKDKKYVAAVCHEFQQAAIDVLVSKTVKAAEKYDPKTIMLAGGVSANIELRKQLGEAVQKFFPETCYLVPDTSLTGDNAAMIAASAAVRWQKMTDSQKKKALDGWKTLQPNANLKLK